MGDGIERKLKNTDWVAVVERRHGLQDREYSTRNGDGGMYHKGKAIYVQRLVCLS